MKKRLLFFIVLFLSVLSTIGLAHADTIGDGPYYQIEAAVGLSLDDLENTGFLDNVKKLEDKKYFKNGTLYYQREIRSYGRGYDFVASLIFIDSKIKKYEIKLGDKSLYSIEFNDDIILKNKFRFNFKKFDEEFSSRDTSYNYVGEYNFGCENIKEIKEEIESVGFNAVGIYKISNEPDITYTTTTNNPHNYLNEYLFKVEGVKNINIDETDYYIIDNKINKGRYYINVSGIKDDKLIIQNIYIVVNDGGDIPVTNNPTTTIEPSTIISTTIDITTDNTTAHNPTTTSSIITTLPNNDDIVINDYQISYKSFISKEAYINYLKLKYKINPIDIESTYFDNYQKIGTYEVVIHLDDKNIKANIKVIDDVKPVIIGNNMMVCSNQKYSISEFKNRLVVTDEIDGEISCKNIKIEDLDNYDENYNKAGSYRVEASISDLSGNVSSSIFYFYVSDNLSSGIYIENATIIITDSSKIKTEDLITFLKKNGLISSTNANLNSSYFNEDSPKGDYNLEVSENSQKENYIIRIQDYDKSKNEVNNQAKNEEKKYDFIPYIAVGSIIVLAVLLLIVLIIKKKH